MLALTGKEIGLGLSGLAFVAFALITAVLLPRRDPEFPGRYKSAYLTLCFLFFIGMMCAVVFLATAEEHEPREEAETTAFAYFGAPR